MTLLVVCLVIAFELLGDSTLLGLADALPAGLAGGKVSADRSPGEWTVRVHPLVTGSEARAEAAQRAARGGSTWAQIQSGRCVTGLRDLTALMPSDAPSGPDTHVVYVAARVALSCRTGTVYLSDFATQLTVQRVANRWLVVPVRH